MTKHSIAGLLLLALTACPAKHDTKETKDAAPPVAAEPALSQHGIGPLKVGMTMNEVRALGMPIDTRADGTHVGPYRIALLNGRVSLIEAHLRELTGLRIGDSVVSRDEKDIAKIATALSSNLVRCDAPQVNLGGTIIMCHDGEIELRAAGPVGVVSFIVRGTIPL